MEWREVGLREAAMWHREQVKQYDRLADAYRNDPDKRLQHLVESLTHLESARHFEATAENIERRVNQIVASEQGPSPLVKG